MKKINLNDIHKLEKDIISLGIDLLNQEYDYTNIVLGKNRIKIDGKLVHMTDESATRLANKILEDQEDNNKANNLIFIPTMIPRLFEIEEAEAVQEEIYSDATIKKGLTEVKSEKDIYIRIAMTALQAKINRLKEAIESPGLNIIPEDREKINNAYKVELKMIEDIHLDLDIYQDRVRKVEVRFRL